MAAVEKEAGAGSKLDALTLDLARLEAVAAGWDESQQSTLRAYRHALEALHKEAFRRLIAGLKQEPAALAAMRSAAADELVYAVLRRFELVRPSLQERIEQALETVRPMLASHGGSVELVAVRAPDAVEIRFTGACEHCPASALTFTEGVEKAIRLHCPEIAEIKQAKAGIAAVPANVVGFISPFALDPQGEWRLVSKLDDLPEGVLHAVTIDGDDLVLWREAGLVTCFQNACAHLGMPFDAGDVAAGIVTCPYHGFQYDLRSGECLTAPEVQLQPHAVRVIGDRVEVRLSR
ncbi:MAG TPA: NifU family protein [Dongiaceae bacterium]|jgi:nitrite reductase/ring-hydroxylating ferredoxin subunit/Fe-S cluster biogenesis protein NfuA|nr:NifU family protein [Dongiaceae bacterium]